MQQGRTSGSFFSSLGEAFVRVRQILRRPAIRVIFFIATTLTFLLLLERFTDPSFEAFLWQNLDTVAILMLCSAVFMLFKSLSLWVAARLQGLQTTYFKCLSIFMVSAYLDLVSFPSRVTSDVYKVGALEPEDLQASARAILVFRIGTGIPYFAFGLLWLMSQHWGLIVGVIGVGVLGAFVVKPKVVRVRAALAHRRTVLAVALLTCVCVVLDVFRASLALSLYVPELNWQEFALWYVTAGLFGTVSGVPLGLGARDATLAFYLKDLANPAETALFLVLIRATGEIFSGCIGWAFIGRDLLRSLRAEISGHERSLK